MKKPLGRTLLEVVVASAILLLVTGYMVQIMISSQRRLQRFEKLIEMEEHAIKALSQISVDLTETHPTAIETQGPKFVVFPSARQLSGQFALSPQGELMWSSVIGYRGEGMGTESKLIRQVEAIPVSPGEAPNPLDLTPPLDLAYFEAGSGQKRLMARGFESLTLSSPSADGVIEVTLHLSVELRRGPQGLRLSNSIKPGN